MLQVQREHFSFVHFPLKATKKAEESTRKKKENYLRREVLPRAYAVSTIPFPILRPCSSGMARQKNFILTYSVELFKRYRMALESWESVGAKDFVPLFPRGTIFTRVRIACRNAVTAELMDVSGL